MRKISIHWASTQADWAQAKALLAELCTHEKSLRPQRKPTTELIDGAFAWVRQNIAAHQGICLLAFDGERAIGYLGAWTDSSDGLDQGDTRIGWISDAYVHPDYRGQNIFTRMLQVAADHFRQIGITRLGTDTLANNIVMQQALARCGFTSHKIVFEFQIAD